MKKIILITLGALLCVLIGTLITLWLAWFPNQSPIRSRSTATAHYAQEFSGCAWRISVNWDRQEDYFRAIAVPDMDYAHSSVKKLQDATPFPSTRTQLPEWSALMSTCEEATRHIKDYPAGLPNVYEVARGWPMRCFHGTSWSIKDTSPNRPSFKVGFKRVGSDDITVKPIMPGLIINIAIFSTVSGFALAVLLACLRLLHNKAAPKPV